MSLSAKVRRAPQRAVTGAYILSTGLDKLRDADDETAKGIHGMASGAYPVLGNMDPKLFLKVLGTGEVALGSALLLPIVPPVAAGLGLAAFSGALLTMYWRTPGMHRDSTDPRPTQQGTPIAKDVWMFGIASSLVVDSVLARPRDKKMELQGSIKGAKKGAKRSAKTARLTAAARTRAARKNAAKSVQAARKSAAEQAQKAALAAKLAPSAAAAEGKAAMKAAADTVRDLKDRVA